MKIDKTLSPFKNLNADIPASVVVFLVSMPLCLGIAMASGAPLYSGIISGIVGGIVVGALSGSSLGVSGPAAGLAVIVLTAIAELGGFEIFLVSVVLAGVLQVIMGYARAGIIGYYFPTSVIHGMLAGIGILIFLKQLPHAFGYDIGFEGDQSFFLSDDRGNTFSVIIDMFDNVSLGAVVITAVSLLILIFWDTKFMRNLSFTKLIPGPLVAVASGITLNSVFSGMDTLVIGSEHLVNVPVPTSFSEFLGNFSFPDFSGLSNLKVYTTAVLIAIVASLETLLSLEAADKLDPYKRISPSNKELKAQGVGNIVAGLIGGIPVTQVIVRSSANVQSGGKTKASTVFHGIWLLLSILLIPALLNKIPLATLAAILMLVGYKLAKPSMFKEMFKQGWGQFLPFIVTIVAMLFSDLLKGIGLGMAVAVFIILKNNLDIPFKIFKGSVKGKQKIKMSLAEDVSFLNKAAIQKSLLNIPDNSILEVDATNTHFIHYDVIEIFKDFEINAKARNISVVMKGCDEVNKKDPIKHFNFELVSPHTKTEQEQLSPQQAQQKLIDGNSRFIKNMKFNRDLQDQVLETSTGQYPFGVVLSCIDSRVPIEMIFDQGIGDLFSVRVAGNTVNTDVLGSMEYSCKVSGSKIVVVMGHSSCGAVNAACKGVELGNITPLLNKIKPAIDIVKANSKIAEDDFCDAVSIENAKLSIAEIRKNSQVLAEMEKKGEIIIVGASYSISTGKVEFFN